MFGGGYALYEDQIGDVDFFFFFFFFFFPIPPGGKRNNDWQHASIKVLSGMKMKRVSVSIK